MAIVSAGLLMCRRKNRTIEFFLIHPGGPYYASKNEGVWSIPKGTVEVGELLEDAAAREFLEETGIAAQPPYHPLGSVKMKSGKIIHAWAFEGTWDPDQGIVSNRIELEWPPKSGKILQVPEADRAEWYDLAEARRMIHTAQRDFLDRAVLVFK